MNCVFLRIKPLCGVKHPTYNFCLTLRVPLVCSTYPDYIDISLFGILLDQPVLIGLMDHWVPVNCSEFSAPLHAESGQTLRELGEDTCYQHLNLLMSY